MFTELGIKKDIPINLRISEEWCDASEECGKLSEMIYGLNI